MDRHCKRNYDDLHEIDRLDMKVDEIFALYLYRLSNRVNDHYYKNYALPFVILFRECFNEYGWGKKVGGEENIEKKLEKNPNLRRDMQTKEYCMENNAEHAPEICNEFVTVYME
jgi:hypothetical protein